MTPLLSHYISLPLDQQQLFIAQLGNTLDGNSASKGENKTATGLVLLMMECARYNQWDTLQLLVAQLPLTPDIYAVMRPVLKELVFHNNVDAVAHIQEAVDCNWSMLAHHQNKHRGLDLKHEVLWRPVFEALARAPVYVDITSILAAINKSLHTSELVEIFSTRISSTGALNSAFFEALYDTICAREDCKPHYAPYLLFRFIERLSDNDMAPLLKKMCCSLTFTTVIETGPSEHHSFPADKEEWINFLYDPTYDLSTDNWCAPVYLQQGQNRMLGVVRTVKVAQAFEQYNQHLALEHIPGVDRLRHAVSEKVPADIHAWLDHRLLKERLHSSVDMTNTPTSSRKI